MKNDFKIYQENYSYSFYDKIILFICQLLFYSVIIIEFIFNYRLNIFLYITIFGFFLYGSIRYLKIITLKTHDDRIGNISILNQKKYHFRILKLTTEEKSNYPIFNIFYSFLLSISEVLSYLLPILFIIIIVIAVLSKLF